MRLSSVHAKSTSRILRADAQKFSPCIGLLTSSTPNLIANLRSLKVDLPAPELARELFHQRTSSYNAIENAQSRRYGPVLITQTRSRASYWLSSEIMGTMVGLAKGSADGKGSLADSRIDEALHHHGIETNYVNREWSGVSMVRYRKIVQLLAKDFENISSVHACPHYTSALPVALAFVWEKAKTKQCLLNYLLAIERASESKLLLSEYDDLRIAGSLMQKEWISDRFDQDFITPERVREAGSQLLFPSATWYKESPSTGSSHLSSTANKPALSNSPAEALEIISASLAMERSFKPPIKLGRYAYGDGKARPDCVEVVVREIIDSLIYDPSSGRLCPELLPPTTLPSVGSFYKSLETGELSDVSTMPAPLAQKDKKKGKSTSNKSSSNTVGTDGAPVAAANSSASIDSTVSVGTVKQYWETTTAGRVWFDLCSELPGGVGYLSSTSDHRPYELKPNMINVCATLRVLLGAPHAAESSVSEQKEQTCDVTKSIPQSLWKLDALEGFWNAHVLTSTATNKHCPLRPIRTVESTLRFRAPFSDTETITRELGSIQFVGGRNAIDIELESAHQLATVKHRLCVDPNMRLWDAQARAPYATYAAADVQKVGQENIESNITGDATVNGVVCSAVLGDTLLNTLLRDIQQAATISNPANHSVLAVASPERDRRIVQALIATRWGEERRQGSNNSDSDGDTGPMSVTDASLTTADAKRQAESAVKTSLHALQLVSFCQDETLLAQLVRWMLQEAPSQLPLDALAKAFLTSYSPQVRASPAFQAMIQAHLGTDNEEGVLLCRLVNIGTENCPSKNKFGLFDLTDELEFSSRVRLLLLYIKYR